MSEKRSTARIKPQTETLPQLGELEGAFKTYDWQKVNQLMLKPAFIFDGRNILDQEQMSQIGFELKSIGKG